MGSYLVELYLNRPVPKRNPILILLIISNPVRRFQKNARRVACILPRTFRIDKCRRHKHFLDYFAGLYFSPGVLDVFASGVTQSPGVLHLLIAHAVTSANRDLIPRRLFT